MSHDIADHGVVQHQTGDRRISGTRCRIFSVDSVLDSSLSCRNIGALGGIRTPNLLIRSQMLYPLSYERRASQSLA
jgi:hypothetical protein